MNREPLGYLGNGFPNMTTYQKKLKIERTLLKENNILFQRLAKRKDNKRHVLSRSIIVLLQPS